MINDTELNKLKEEAIATVAKQQKLIEEKQKLIEDIDTVQQQREAAAAAEEREKAAKEAAKVAEIERRTLAANLTATQKRIEAALGIKVNTKKQKSGRGEDAGERATPASHDLTYEERAQKVMEQLFKVAEFNGKAINTELHFGWPVIGVILQVATMLPEPLRVVCRREGSQERAVFERTELGNRIHASYVQLKSESPDTADAQLLLICQHLAFLLNYYQVPSANDKKADMPNVYAAAALAYNKRPITPQENVAELNQDDLLQSMVTRLRRQKNITWQERKNIVPMKEPLPKGLLPWVCPCGKAYRWASMLEKHAKSKHPEDVDTIMSNARRATQVYTKTPPAEASGVAN